MSSSNHSRSRPRPMTSTGHRSGAASISQQQQQAFNMSRTRSHSSMESYPAAADSQQQNPLPPVRMPQAHASSTSTSNNANHSRSVVAARMNRPTTANLSSHHLHNSSRSNSTSFSHSSRATRANGMSGTNANNALVKLLFPCGKHLFSSLYFVSKIPNYQQFECQNQSETATESKTLFIPRDYDNFHFILQYLQRGTSHEMALSVLHTQLQQMHIMKLQLLALDCKFLQLTKLYSLVSVYLRRLIDPAQKRFYHCGLEVSENGLTLKWRKEYKTPKTTASSETHHASLQQEGIHQPKKEQTETSLRWLAATPIHSYSKGSHHFEIIIKSTEVMLGVTNEPLALTPLDDEKQRERVIFCFYCAKDGNFYNGDEKPASYGEACAEGDRLGIYLDMDQHKVQFYRNDVPMGWISLPKEIPAFSFQFLFRGEGSELEILPFSKKPSPDQDHVSKSYLLDDERSPRATIV